MRLRPACRQRPQQSNLLGQPRPSARVELLEELSQECLVLAPAGKVATPSQQQSLFECPLEAVMALLGVPVLVRLARTDRLTIESVMTQQAGIAWREGRPLGARRHGRGESVRAVFLGHSAELEQGVLQTLGQALEALREADAARLPIRVGQHEVIDQMIERHPVDTHVQLRAVGEVTRTEPAGVMHLGEEHLPGRPLKSSPLLDASLQGPQLTIDEATGVGAFELLEESSYLQAGVERELFLQR
jgi:hypothetical protein